MSLEGGVGAGPGRACTHSDPGQEQGQAGLAPTAIFGWADSLAHFRKEKGSI